MADDRTYIKVHDGIEDHPKIATLSDRSFRILVTTWGWCSRHKTNGRVPDAVWRKRAPTKVREELESVSLVEQRDGYVVMHDYLKHQRSAELIEGLREVKQRAGRMGNHRRWHVEKGIVDPACEFCVEDLSQEGSQVRSQSDRTGTSGSDRKTSPETETETETEEEPSLRSGSPARAPALALFDEFWDAYPRKTGKAEAVKAWPKAIKRLEAPRLVAAAQYWAGLWAKAGVDKQFIPYPATWLNGQRWNDEPPASRATPTNGHQPYRNPDNPDVYKESLL
jgi:hypothetical protein